MAQEGVQYSALAGDERPVPSAPPADYVSPFDNAATPGAEDFAEGEGGGGEDGEGLVQMQRFQAPPSFRDFPWYVAFLVHLALLVALLVYGSVAGVAPPKNGTLWAYMGAMDKMQLFAYAGLVGAACVLATIFSLFYLFLMRVSALALIYGSLAVTTLLGVGSGVFFVVQGQVVIGVVFLVVALFNVLFYFMIRRRLRFTALLLATVARVTREFPGLLAMAVLVVPVTLAWTIFWVRTGVVAQQIPWLRGPVIGVVLFVSYFWVQQVLQNLVHMAAAGTYATWYFMEPEARPKYPTWAALKRASTLSFGSIVLGSLVVAIVQTLRAVLSNARRLNDRVGSALLGVVFVLADCLLGLLEWLLRFFNVYAYSYCAIYGTTYVESAKRAWALLKRRGLDALINDSVAHSVMHLGSLICGLLSAVIGFVLVLPGAGAGQQFSLRLVFSGVGFVVGFSVVSAMLTVIGSGINTLYVCLAESPERLLELQPELYREIQELYPGACDRQSLV